MDTYLRIMEIITILVWAGCAGFWAWFIYYLLKNRRNNDSSEVTETANELGQPV